MDGESLASDLLKARAKLLQVPAHREITRLMHGEWFVLNYLFENSGIVHPKELSEKMSVSTARIASLLKKMEEQRLIVRLADEQDSRQVIVQLTEQGAAEIGHIRSEVLKHTAELLESLGAEDARAYIRIQEKIYRIYVEKNCD